MKFSRSTKCSLKFATRAKRETLDRVMDEYSRAVNVFIERFWKQTPCKGELLKNIIAVEGSWLGFSIRQCAAREAIDMIKAVRKRWKNKPEKQTKPIHRGNKMCLNQNVTQLQVPKGTTEFDGWLHFRNIGRKTIFDVPIRFHRHWHRLSRRGKFLQSYIIVRHKFGAYVQLCFQIETDLKKEQHNIIGIDTGINTLAMTSEGKPYGEDVRSKVERIIRCKHGSRGQKRASRALRHYMDEVVRDLMKGESPDLIVVEKLKGITWKTKRRLVKNMRRLIGKWNVRYWLRKLQYATEDNRVSFRSVSPYQTSITCPLCDHVDQKNRRGEVFCCLSCGYEGNADFIGAQNILRRFFADADAHTVVGLAQQVPVRSTDTLLAAKC